MKPNTKKWFGLAAMLLVLALMLTGCGEVANGSGGGSTTTTTTTTLVGSNGGTTTTLGPQDDHDPDRNVTTTTKKPSSTTKKPSGNTTTTKPVSGGNASSVSKVPAYSGNPFVTINGNEPDFTAAQKKSTKSYETYGALDSLGRCTTAIACVGKDLMPTGDRGNIGSVTPTGWKQGKYDTSIVPGTYLYNRCHLIGWQLAGEDDNEKNLITGTQYLNIEGMLPFENMVADYIKETDNHVLYRVTPVFEGNNLVASGVQIEAYSIEDDGDGICFNVYCYNVQPKISINYKDGSNYQIGVTTTRPATSGTYILNISSHKIHKKDTCSAVKKMADKNKEVFTGNIQEKLDEGYTYCGLCS